MILQFQRRGVQVDGPAPAAESIFYRVGDLIPTSGIYRAVHGDHRVAHDITLLSGEAFPRCNKCGDSVFFELLAAAPARLDDRDFRIRLYEIPHPASADDAVEAA